MYKAEISRLVQTKMNYGPFRSKHSVLFISRIGDTVTLVSTGTNQIYLNIFTMVQLCTFPIFIIGIDCFL